MYVIFILLLVVSQLNLLYDVAPSLNKEEEKNASIKFLTVERGKKHFIDDVLSEVNTSKIGFIGKSVLRRLERASLKLKSETLILISGDWNVTGNETYVNEEIILTGNLIVKSGGNLTFINVTLRMNCSYDGEFQIKVEDGGRFNILSGSIITAENPEYEYLFYVEKYAILRMYDSELHECGYPAGHLGVGTLPRRPGLTIRSNDVIIKNNIITNNYCGITCNNSRPTITNNTITNNWWFGVYCYGSLPDLTISNNTITNNKWGGIYVITSSPIIKNNIIANNTEEGHATYGIYVDSGSPLISDNIIRNHNRGIYCQGYLTIVNNTITENTAYAISAGSHSVIVNNTITNNGGGVTVAAYSVISGNLIANNDGYGISCGGRNLTISNNIIVNNTYSGIYIINCYYPSYPLSQYPAGNITYNLIKNNSLGIECYDSKLSITKNIITKNNEYGIYGYRSSLEVHYCNIYDNNGVGLYNDEPWDTADATYNWWGGPDGPVGEGGDGIAGDVVYDPWLTEPVELPPPLDIVPPSLEITYPTGGEHVRGNITVTVSASDPYEVDRVEFYVNGVLVFTDYEAPYEYEWNTTDYPDGNYTIRVMAYDVSGNGVEKSVDVIVDNTAPLAEILSPLNFSYVSGVVNVTVKSEDENLNVTMLYIDGVLVVSWTKEGTYTYSWNTTTYSDGNHTINLIVEDKAGNFVERTITVIIDNSSPLVGEPIQIPVDPCGGEDVTIRVSISDELSGVANATLYYKVGDVWKPLEMVFKEDMWEAVIPGQENGTKVEYYVRAYDKVGNWALTNIYSYIVRETIPPSLKIKSPLNNSFVKEIITVSIVANDSSGIKKVEFYINEELVYVKYETPYEWNWNTTNYVDGNRTIKLVVYDKAGNRAEETITVIVDNTQPNIEIISPIAGEYLRGIINITVFGEDSGSGIDKISFIVDGVLVFNDTIPPYEYIFDTTFYLDGSHNLTVVAYDNVNNTASKSIVVHLDKTSPVVGVVSPANGSWVSGVVKISVPVSDVGAGVDYVAFGIYGQPELLYNDTVEPYEYSWDTRNYAEGKQLLVIVVKDKAGNYQCVILEYYVDNTPPSISAVEYPSEVKGGEVAKINITVSDVKSGISEVILSYSVDGGKTWTNITATAKGGDIYGATIPGQPAGKTVQFKVIAFDIAGNVVVSSIYSYKVVSGGLASGVSLNLTIGIGVAVAVAAAVVFVVIRRRR